MVIHNQAPVSEKVLALVVISRFEVRAGFEVTQVLLYSGGVNTQELVRRSHYVDVIGLALGKLSVHELIHWIISWRITLITRNSVLRRAEPM